VTASYESTELRVSRRTALRFIGAGTGTLLLAACAPVAPATQSGPTAAAASAVRLA